MKTQSPLSVTRECVIVVINDVLQTRREYPSPQAPEEAIDNHGACTAASDFIMQAEDNEPIGCAIHCYRDRVVIHWFAETEDQDAARAAIEAALAGENGGAA